MLISPSESKRILSEKLSGNIAPFIVIEGVNGAGKSTIIKFLEDELNKAKKDVLFTREPGGTEVGLKIRSLVLGSEYSDWVVPRSELFLFAADRAIHVDKFIKPNIEQGKVVVSDRYYFSTVAFQGFGRGKSDPNSKEFRNNIEKIISLNRWATNNLEPDVVLLLDIDAETGLKRVESRNSSQSSEGGPDKFEIDKFETEEKLDFHRRVRAGYKEMAELEGSNFVVIDASKTLDQVKKDVMSCLKPLF